VLTGSAKGHPLGLEAWLREDLHNRLLTYLDGYAERCNRQPGTAVWAPRPAELPIEAWREQRLEALRTLLNTHRLLLAVDNFETNLATAPEEDRPGYICLDPHWGATLRSLAQGLESGFSKLLVTSRRLPADLAVAQRCLRLAVGPLPEGEALVFLRTAPHFRALLYPEDEGQREANMGLLARVLHVSRGHPYLLARLHGLAADPEDLTRRLVEFEAAGGCYGDMGRIFAAAPTEVQQAEQERYFDDITGTATDALIRACSPEAQRLLRAITLTQELMNLDRIAFVGSVSEEATPEEDRAYMALLLAELVDQGLLVEEPAEVKLLDGTTTERPVYRWHEIVRERAEALLPAATASKDGEEGGDGFPVRGYLRRYADMNLSMLRMIDPHRVRSKTEIETAVQTSRCAIRYLYKLRDYAGLSLVIGDVHNLSSAAEFRRELSTLIHELLEEVPSDEERQRLLRSIADLTHDSGDPRAALAYYKEAASLALARKDWRACGIIVHQMGIAFRSTGDYASAREAYELALAFMERARGSTTATLSTRASLAHLLIVQGQLEQAEAEVAEIVREAEAFYAASQEAGWEPEPGATMAPDDLLISCLHVQKELEYRRQDWPALVYTCDRSIEVKRESGKKEVEIAEDILHCTPPLIVLGDLEQARRNLEYCLDLFRQEGQVGNQSVALGHLGRVWEKRGDLPRCVGFEEKALSFAYQGSNYGDAAILHNNLAVHLGTLGRFAEALPHAVAAVLLSVILGDQQWLATSLGSLRNLRRHTVAQGLSDSVPTVQELVADFHGLTRFLAEWGLTQAQAQAALDQAVARTEEIVEAWEAQMRRIRGDLDRAQFDKPAALIHEALERLGA